MLEVNCGAMQSLHLQSRAGTTVGPGEHEGLGPEPSMPEKRSEGGGRSGRPAL